MAHEPIPPYPKNAPGDFYVQDQCCITCEAPYHEAPDLMAHDEEGGHHCYFKRQPETPDEVERAIRACRVSCVRAVRYSGDAPEILRRFQELGRDDSCDVLSIERREGGCTAGITVTLTLKEKLAMARRAVEGERKSPPESGPHPLFDRDLDG